MYVIINGVSSDTIQGLQVLSLPPITKPKMRRQVDTIDGRAGDIITELGYEAYDRTITVLLHHNYDLDAITAFFNTSGEIIFSNEPDKKYYFQLLEKIDYERAVQFKTANVTFHVQPYKYPVSETPLTVSSVEWEGTDYDQTPYIFRAVADSSVEVGNREIVEQITGGTVAWNQLCNASSVTITSGHKYYMKKGTAYSIGASTGSAITGLTSGSDMVIDLTQLFGTTIADYLYSLETATAGAGVSLFRNLFPKDYYAYNAGELMSVKTSARETTGKNLFDQSELIEGKHYNTSGVLETQAQRVSTPKIWCRGMSKVSLGYASSVSSTNAIRCIWDADGNLINRAVPANTVIDGVNGYLTDLSSFPNACYIGYSFYSTNGSVVGSISDVMIANSMERISYIPYEKHTYPLSNIELRGIPKLANNKLQYDGDIYKADGTVTRKYGIRAYQSGDATGDTMITDGTNTVYQLSSPTTETTTSYTETQICDADGIESFVDDRDVQIPVGHKTKYKQMTGPVEITVPNAGNVPSAPTIQLTGSGTVGVYLGNAQALQVIIPEDGITIDTEAQDATSNGQLANRSVTGDYDSVRLQPGDNDVSFSGDVSAVITNYTRWV